jgi:adenine/guanine/hypoxanthine permease
MAVVTNYPLALAPGMGSNAFLAYQVCLTMHVPWQAAFGLVFLQWCSVLNPGLERPAPDGSR